MDYMTYRALMGRRGAGDGGDGYGPRDGYEGGQRYGGGYPDRGSHYGPHMPPYEDAGPWAPPYGRGEEMEDNVVPMDAYRRIGFGESRRRMPPRREDGRFRRPRSEMDGGPMDHYGGEDEQAVQFGGTFRMADPSGRIGGGKLTKEMAEQWVENMEGESEEHPLGGVFSWETAKDLAGKVGYGTSGQRMIDFYAIINAMYSDYNSVATRYKLNTPEFYAYMAKAWLEDADAVKNKAAVYYRCIVEKG